ncbi:hypothetical protein CEXT_30341 [Caerostris extrusa]|uniref:Uncharacterized protein n=1 Tax=Caerostris extrusa TaxID=172846 RepID=A0AAV4T3F4_CAEEX|nr:hypothetical protein CEXT_30341 [Caerostris extrusa]
MKSREGARERGGFGAFIGMPFYPLPPSLLDWASALEQTVGTANELRGGHCNEAELHSAQIFNTIITIHSLSRKGFASNNNLVLLIKSREEVRESESAFVSMPLYPLPPSLLD